MPSPAPQPCRTHHTVRWQARLEAETQTRLEALARTVHRRRAEIVRRVMRWALAPTHRWTAKQSTPDHPTPVHVLVDPELCRPVQDAAARGVRVAAWVRQVRRQVTPEALPPRRRAVGPATRAHESGDVRRTFGLRLDAETSRTRETFTEGLGRSAAEVVRQRIARAEPEDVPERWHLAIAERR